MLKEKVMSIATSQLGKSEQPKNSNWGKPVQDYLASVGITFPKVSGIYGIKCGITGKIYIGSSVNISKRIKNHFWALRNNKHRNNHLQNAYNKSVFKEFYPFVLELCKVEDLQKREQVYLDFYKSFINDKGYNIQPKAYSNSGNKMSENTKKKISEYQKGKPKSEESKKLNSLAHLGEKNARYGKRPLQENINKLIEYNFSIRKSYTFINPLGVEVCFLGLAKFCKENNLSTSAMCQVAKGRQKEHKGWTIKK